MTVKPGARLRSAVCDTEVIVVRPPAGEIELHCGGVPMVAHDVETTDGDVPAAGWDGGTKLGKRYTSTTDAGLEVLVTKEGKGTLGDGQAPLELKEAKPLPSSD